MVSRTVCSALSATRSRPLLRAALLLGAGLCCGLGLLSPTVGHAQPEAAAAGDPMAEARAAFEAATTAYDAGDFELALEQFEIAHRLTGSADLLYNIATVSDRLRRDQAALDAYEAFLAERPDTEDRENIEARIRVLREAIEEAEARAASEAAAAGASSDTAPPSSDGAEPAPMEHEGPGVGPWVVMGASVAAAATGVALLFMAQSDVDSVEGAAVGSRWSEVANANDRAPKFGIAGAILTGLGGAGVAAGLVWLLTGGEDVPVAVGLGSVHLRGTF